MSSQSTECKAARKAARKAAKAALKAYKRANAQGFLSRTMFGEPKFTEDQRAEMRKIKLSGLSPEKKAKAEAKAEAKAAKKAAKEMRQEAKWKAQREAAGIFL